MTFTTQIKDEITKEIGNRSESLISLGAYLLLNSQIEETITVFSENASVMRWLFNVIKQHYNVAVKLTIRTIKRFKTRNVYILEIKDKKDLIVGDIDNLFKTLKTADIEEKGAFLKGLFLACGSINDQKTNLYHLEFLVKDEKIANNINDILLSLEFKSKVLKREKEYMVYIKVSENISDFLKYIGATSALFYFEDIRIYKDHKNMVNRLNNCEQANVEKSLKSSNQVLENIEYLDKNELLILLGDTTNEIIRYKKMYPDTSMGELAEIITLETNRKITKSGINHHFRKINELVSRHSTK